MFLVVPLCLMDCGSCTIVLPVRSTEKVCWESLMLQPQETNDSKILLKFLLWNRTTSAASELETRRFRRAIWILQIFSLGLQTVTLLARHSLARKKFVRSICVLCHFKGDALWPILFIERHRCWWLLYALLRVSPQLKKDWNDFTFQRDETWHPFYIDVRLHLKDTRCQWRRVVQVAA